MTDWRNPATNDAFLKWRDTFPEQHWSKNDLSACRLGFDAGYAFALEPTQAPQSEPIDQLGKALNATMDANERSAVGFRKTFVVPEGYEAVRDNEGKATGEVRPIPAQAELEVVATEHKAEKWAETTYSKGHVQNLIGYTSTPLVRLTDAQAALTACQQEVERYKEMYVQKANEKVHEFRRAEAAESRNAELVKALEPFTRRAPVQGFSAGIPWDMHLRAYDVYCKKYSPQKALIEGGCRGGFGTEELDMFIPGWREEVKDDFRRARTALGGQSNGA